MARHPAFCEPTSDLIKTHLSFAQLNDAYEEVDEQRQLVAQWKRKTQKVHGEMNDIKLHLEEQTTRNALLEKKQRKFDAEIGSLQEERRQEALTKEKLYREIDELKRLKYSLEDQVQVGRRVLISCYSCLG